MCACVSVRACMCACACVCVHACVCMRVCILKICDGNLCVSVPPAGGDVTTSIKEVLEPSSVGLAGRHTSLDLDMNQLDTGDLFVTFCPPDCLII